MYTGLASESNMLKNEVSQAEAEGFVGAKYRGQPEAKKIKQLWGDSMHSDWKEFGAPFDLILIDGSHDYPYVKSDSLNALKHIRPGGTILWHDYGSIPDVSKAVDELAQDYPIAAIAREENFQLVGNWRLPFVKTAVIPFNRLGFSTIVTAVK